MLKKGFSIGDLFEIFAIPHAAQKRYHNIENLVVAGTAIFHSAASIRVNQVTLKDAAILQNDFEFQAEKLVWTSGTVRGSKLQVGILLTLNFMRYYEILEQAWNLLNTIVTQYKCCLERNYSYRDYANWKTSFFITARQQSCEKVLFSVVYICPYTAGSHVIITHDVLKLIVQPPHQHVQTCSHLQTKLRKGNVFTPVCQSFCSQGGGEVSASVHPGIHTSRVDTHPPGRHPQVDQLAPVGQWAICILLE